MNIKTLNKYNKEINILHFQGKNLEQFEKTSKLIFEDVKLDPIEENLSIVSCWTNNVDCVLAQQLWKNNIKIYNALPSDYDFNKPWDMRNKIKYYIDCLENIITTDIVLLLDGYDVLFSSTKDIVKKFKAQPYRILFNSTVNNYPPVYIDEIKNRDNYDNFAIFFNAGCCIGYREDLIKFYKRCYQIINIENLFNSEQYVLRHVFSEYSNDPSQQFIWIDFKRDIFHTMGYMLANYDANTKIIKIIDNLEVPQNKRDSEKYRYLV